MLFLACCQQCALYAARALVQGKDRVDCLTKKVPSQTCRSHVPAPLSLCHARGAKTGNSRLRCAETKGIFGSRWMQSRHSQMLTNCLSGWTGVHIDEINETGRKTNYIALVPFPIIVCSYLDSPSFSFCSPIVDCVFFRLVPLDAS